MPNKKISANDCKTMFNDKFNLLTMKEIGTELKHFSLGTAPESPSFLVNQDAIKKNIIEKFSDFFDKSKAQVLEVMFLKSNYGNGKSHFIRSIYTFLNMYENVITRQVSLKQEETDLKKKILESVSQKILRDCAEFIVKTSEIEFDNNNKDMLIMEIMERYAVDAHLARIIYEAARCEEITYQIQAIAILKNNYLPEYLKYFKCKKTDLNNEFYYNVIRLISQYMKENDYYLVIVFDEYEHVFSWKNENYRKSLYADIKLFTDNIGTFGNLFFVFAESDSVNDESESMDDPAFKSRKANLTFQIADISSENEVEKLFRMILKRYEKYYEISLEQYYDEIFNEVIEDPQIKEKTNYRAYTQAIMRRLEEYRNNPPKKRVKKDQISNLVNDSASDMCIKWSNSTSISKKTILCEILEKIIMCSGGIVSSLRKKQGEIIASIKSETVVFFVVATDNPSINDLNKRIKKIEEDNSYTYLLYPILEADLNENEKINVIYYSESSVLEIIKKLNNNELEYVDVNSYLKLLSEGSTNA